MAQVSLFLWQVNLYLLFPQQQGVDPNFLRATFERVDRDRSGEITANELQQALSNGTWKPFNTETVRLMIGMFDRDRSGSINFPEFCQLWNYITQWLNCFRSFDRDNSNSIDFYELKSALTTFGYRLSDQFFSVLMKRYDREGKGCIIFDDFIQLCVQLQMLTNAFRHHDTDLDGWVNMSYEQFLTTVLSLNCY